MKHESFSSPGLPPLIPNLSKATYPQALQIPILLQTTPKQPVLILNSNSTRLVMQFSSDVHKVSDSAPYNYLLSVSSRPKQQVLQDLDGLIRIIDVCSSLGSSIYARDPPPPLDMVN